MLLKVDLQQVSASGLELRFIEAVKGERLEHFFYNETKELNFTLFSRTIKSKICTNKVKFDIKSKYVMEKGTKLLVFVAPVSPIH